jgi:hypothetical protein
VVGGNNWLCPCVSKASVAIKIKPFLTHLFISHLLLF